MTTARIEKKIIVTMNPDELRALANKMENEFPKKSLGDSTFIDFLAYSGELRIDLHADQQWFNKRGVTKWTWSTKI